MSGRMLRNSQWRRAVRFGPGYARVVVRVVVRVAARVAAQVVVIGAAITGTNADAAGLPFVEHPVASVPAPSAIAVADVDGDGDIDAVTASLDGMIFWHASSGQSPPVFTLGMVSEDAGAVSSVAAADLDGDGDVDVLAFDRSAGAAVWYENDGNLPPGFLAHTIVTGVLGADFAGAADLDGDDDIDVIAASNGAPLAWFDNDGAMPPVFTERPIATTLAGPFRATVVDVDGDEDPDLLCTSSADDAVAWYESDGAEPPVFTERVITSAAAGAASVDGSDLDGDGDLDIAAVSTDDDTLAWYENDGGLPPVFTERLISLSADGAASIRTVDLDDDGDADLLTAESLADSVTWYENLGGSPPAFAAHVVSSLLDGAVAAIAVDIDGDSDRDVLAAALDGNLVTLFENAPSPVFNETRCTYHETLAEAIAAAVDGDVIVAPREQFLDEPDVDFAGHRVSIRSTDAIFQPEFGRYTLTDDAVLETAPNRETTINGTVVVPPGADAQILTNALTASGGTRIEIGAAAGLVVETGAASEMESVTLIAANATLLLTADGALGGDPPGFAEEVVSTESVSPFGVHVADLDGDGDTDVLSASFGDATIAWYENTPGAPPSFTRRIVGTGAVGARSVHAADVDGDGDIDPIAAAQLVNRVAWYENDGGAPPAFVEHVVSSSVTTAVSVFPADLDADGDVDLLAASFAGARIAWFENDGGAPPAFTERNVTTSAIGAFSVFAADVDGDGDVDVLSASQVDNKIAWYQNNGASPPAFEEMPITIAALRAYAVSAADLDGDGDTDVMSASQQDQRISWYENDGGSPPAWTTRMIASGVPDATSIHATDVDGDGDIDVLAAIEGSDSIAWYENSGLVPPTFLARVLTTGADGAKSATAGDLDGDGDTDVVAASSDDNTIAWFSNLRGVTSIAAGGALVVNGALSSRLPLELFGGHVSADDGFTNAAGGTVSGFGTIAADVTNAGRAVLLADTEVSGDYHNTGSTVIRNGTLAVFGSLRNDGELIGDFSSGATAPAPASHPTRASGGGDGVFVQSDFRSAPTAVLRMPAGESVVRLAGAFDVEGNDAARYDLSSAELRFVGSANQTMEVMSADIGPDPAGLDRGVPGHFPLGTLRVGPVAARVRLQDLRDNDGLGQATCEAVYADEVVIDEGATLITAGCRVYYNRLTLAGMVDEPANLNAIVVEPPCPADVNEDRLVGFADILQMLASWGPCPPGGDCPSDADGDGTVGFEDVLLVLANWGDCPGE